MKRVLFAFILMLLAWPVTAQVEIRGLTVAPPDRPGNGGIMLKSVISTRLPGEVSEINANSRDRVGIILNGKSYDLSMRNGELVHEAVASSDNPFIAIIRKAADLDGDGQQETVKFEHGTGESRMIVFSQTGPTSLIEKASIAGYGQQPFVEFADLMRTTGMQIVAVSNTNHCLRVITFDGSSLKDIGALSCGAPLVGNPVKTDIDGDGRYDLIIARQPDRIEIFLR